MALLNKSFAASESFASPITEKMDPRRLYEGMREMPLAERMMGSLRLVYNKFWMNRHEKKALGLKKDLDKLDLEIAALERAKTEIAKNIEFFQRENMSGIESFRLGLKEKDQQIRNLLNKKDKIQSKFEARDNKRKLYLNSRDRIVNKFIGHYSERLRPMEAELAVLQSQKNRINDKALAAELKHQEALLGRIHDLESKKIQIERAFEESGMSNSEIRKNEAVRALDDLIKKEYAMIQEEKDDFAQRKSEIDRKIAEANEKSSPYRNKREEYIRVKENRLVDMRMEARNRGINSNISEDVISHTREIRKEEDLKVLEVEEIKLSQAERGETSELTETIENEEMVMQDDRENEKKEKWKNFLTALVELKKQKENEKTVSGESVDGPARAAAWHTIYKLIESPDLMLEDLNADSVEEGDRKFLELTRKLWTELAVHENPDQDARTCLGLLELAGIDTSQYKTAPQKKMREMIKSGLAMDFGDEHGVVAEEGGKLIVIDHHGKKSDRTTSASRFVYEMLVEMGLMQREEYLDKFIEFTTVCDNMRFSPEEMERVYQNYSKNLYGLAYRMKPDDVLELFKNGADPMADLPEDYLKSHQYYNLASKSEESLFDLSNQMENKMKKGEMELDRLEKVKNDQERTPENIRKNDFVVDTGEDRFGKIFIDTRKNAGKDKYFNRIDGANHSEQLAVFRRGYGGYLVWSPEQDSFVLFTKRKMDEEFLPGGLSQGFNMRGHMWMKPRDKEGEPKVKLTVTLEEIFSKLSGKDDFEGKEKLKKIIAIDAGAKEILKLMYEKTLTEGEIRRIAKKVGVRSSGDMIKNIASQLATNKKYKKIDEIFRDKKRLIASTDRSNPKEIERILIETLLEYQENSKVAK